MSGYGGDRGVADLPHQSWGRPLHSLDGRTAGNAVEVFVAAQLASVSPLQAGPAKPAPLLLGSPHPHTLNPAWGSRRHRDKDDN